MAKNVEGRRPVGRPPIPEGEKLSKNLNCKVRPREFEQILEMFPGKSPTMIIRDIFESLLQQAS
jgi:hypothetical protein